MANLKLYWEDSNYKGITLDESHYVRYEHHADLDMGTSDFSIGCIFYADSTMGNKATLKGLISKYDGDLASDTGYYLAYDATNEKITLALNDGDVAATTVSSDNSSFLDDTWHCLFITVDRSGNATIYKNGASVKTGSVTAASGSISKTNPVFFGYNFVANSYFKGYLSGVYICKGFLPDSTWVQEFYYKTIYNYPRIPPVYGCTVFPFDNSLTGLEYSSYGNNVSHAGILLPSGTVTYITNYPSSYSYTLSDNFKYEYEQGYLPLDMVIRAQDGTAKVYQGGTKQRLYLSFTSNTVEQRYAVESAWLSRQPIDVYLDADSDRTLQGFLISPPIIREIFNDVFEYELEIEEL